MVGATTTTITNTATMANNLINQASQKESQRPIEISRTYKCSMCSVDFADSIQQRLHMRGDWQYVPFTGGCYRSNILNLDVSIYNLHRKVDGQLPVSKEEYLNCLSTESERSSARKEREGSDELFVRRSVVRKSRRAAMVSSEQEEDEESTSEEQSIEDDEDIVYEEVDSTSEDVSSSEDDVESGEDAVTWRNDKELRLASGKVISSRTSRSQNHTKRQNQQPANPTSATDPTNISLQPPSRSQSSSPPLTLAYLASTSSSFPAPLLARHHHSLTLSKRDTQGIIGLNDIERKKLLTTARKMMKVEERDRKGFAESVDWKGNSQKHYRIGGSRGGKKMGGLEKRLG